VIYNARVDTKMPTGVHVKLLGWIKSAFVKVPAGPSQVEPPPEAPHTIDSRLVPDEVTARSIDADTINNNKIDIDDIDTVEPESRPEIPIEAAPASTVSVESESPTRAEPESRVAVEPESAPDQQEIDRRRGMVRAFFNDYWSTADEKPTSFAERLDRAEGYINERVAAGGESWQLGPATRKQLGLPPPRKR
jgi:hypothetical protein